MAKSKARIEIDRPSPPASVTHLIILGHPATESFNAAIAKRYVETVHTSHQKTVLRDLYALGFDPLLKESERFMSKDQPFSPDVEKELDMIRKCDVVTFIFPLWFGTPPAIIKGYVDRVFGAGFRLTDLATQNNDLFGGKRLAVVTTSASTLPWLESQGVLISLRQSFEQYLKAIFGFAKSYHYHADSLVDNLDQANADRILCEVAEFARSICAETSMSTKPH